MSEDPDPRIPAALRPGPERQAGPDPLKYCVFTTLALLALGSVAPSSSV